MTANAGPRGAARNGAAAGRRGALPVPPAGDWPRSRTCRWPRPGWRPRRAGDGHGVLVLPGFLASDHSTAVLRRFAGGLGYQVSGRNLPPTAARPPRCWPGCLLSLRLCPSGPAGRSR